MFGKCSSCLSLVIMDHTMRLFVTLSCLFFASLVTSTDAANPRGITTDDITTTTDHTQTWNTISANDSSSATSRPTGPFSPIATSSTDEPTENTPKPFTLPELQLHTTDASTVSNGEYIIEESIIITDAPTFEISNVSVDWCAMTEGGCPDEGGLFISSTIDAVEGNGTSTVNDRWVWSSIRWTPWVIIQMLVAIFGIIGNALVIIVVYQHRAANRTTDTLIATLAVADLLTSLFVIPLPTAQRVPNTWVGQVYCKVVLSSLLMWANMAVSTYLLIAISIERYLAVVHPIYFTMILSRQRVKVIIVLIWVLNYMITVTFSYFIVTIRGGRCTMIFSSNYISILIGTALFVYRVFFPSLVMVITQVLIARKLYRQAVWFRSKTDASTQDNIHLSARSRVIQLMLIVILIYVLCWTPSQFAFLLFTLSVIPPWYPYSIYHRTLTLFGFFNSCANPIIYTLRHAQFRQAIVAIFKRDVSRSHPLFGSDLLKKHKSVSLARKDARILRSPRPSV